MIVRLSTYLKAVAQAERARGRVSEMGHQIDRLEDALSFERSEVRRLTDMIANLRNEGLVAGPGHGAPEPTWGRYSLDEADAAHIEEAPGSAPGFAGVDPTSEEMAQVEAEVRQELEEALAED